MKKWRCTICDYIYDEALGEPDEGIAPGTKFEDLPETWTCPDCGAAKSEFILDEEDEAVTE
ncbi:MAG TPA: rubredoxin [Nevskiaceae bacterium]